MASQYRPYADIKYKTREYTDKEGKTKGVWLDVGTIFATPHLSSMFQVLDALPVNFDGKLSIFKRDDFDQEQVQKPDEVHQVTDEALNNLGLGA